MSNLLDLEGHIVVQMDVAQYADIIAMRHE